MYMILASAIIRRPVSEECHHPRCTRLERFMRQAWGRRLAPSGRDHSDCPDGNIIERWRIVLRARASLVQSAGLGWSLDSHLTLDWAKKSFERIARRQSVGKNLNSRKARCGFSKYPCHFLNGAISSVQNCAKAGRGTTTDLNLSRFKISRPSLRQSKKTDGQVAAHPLV